MPVDNNHWRTEWYKERMTTKQWKECLLAEDDMIIYKGRLRRLTAKSLGAGVVEVSKVPLKEEK